MRLVMIVIVALWSTVSHSYAGFVGDLELTPAGCERNLECTVNSDFGYIDSKGVGWQARAGLKTDGASIPWYLQSLVGGQFDKAFIRAAVIHDHYCSRHVRSWRDTHWVFHDALLASGVEASLAQLMYFAVYLAGPKWVRLIKGESCPVGESCTRRARVETRAFGTRETQAEDGQKLVVRSAQFDDENFKKHLEEVKKLIAEKGGKATLQELEQRAEAARPGDFFYINADVIAVDE